MRSSWSRVLLVGLALALMPSGVDRAVAVKAGQAIELTLGKGESRAFALRLPARSFTEARVSQLGADVAIRLLASDGRVLRESDQRRSTAGDETIAITTGQASDVTLEVRQAFAEAEPGRFRVLVLPSRARVAEDDARVDAADHMDRADVELRADDAASVARARDDARAAAAAWAALGDRVHEAIALRTEGEAALDLGDRRSALAALAKAVDAARAGGDDTEQALAGATLAATLSDSGRPATDPLEDAAGAADRTSDAHAKIEVVLSRLLVATNADRPLPDADARLAALERDVARLGDPGLACRVAMFEAIAADRHGDRERGAAALDRVITLARKHGRDRPLAEALHTRSQLQSKYDADYARAAQTEEEALVLWRRVGDRNGEGRSLGQLGSSLRRKGDYARAREAARASLALQREVGSPVDEAFALEVLGTTELAAGEPDTAIDLFRQAEALYERSRERYYQARTVFHRARAEDARARWVDALDAIERAIALSEEVRQGIPSDKERATFSASIRRYYELAIDLLARLADRDPARRSRYVARAFAFSERAHARSLLEMLAHAGVAAEAVPDDPAILARGMRTVGERNAIALEYFLGAPRSYLFVVSRDGLRMIALPPQSTIESLARAARGALVARNASIAGEAAEAHQARIEAADAEWTASSRALADAVLRPAGAIPSGAQIIVVADGALNAIPFAALPREPDADGRRVLVVERSAVVGVPSLTIAATAHAARAPRRGPPAALIVADPVYSRSDPRVDWGFAGGPVAAARAAEASGAYRRLRFSRSEAEGIAALLPRDGARVVLDFDASRAQLLDADLRRYDWIHIASHGHLDVETPELSCLVLSQVDRGGGPVDGLVPIADIERLRLDAELVVLSACDTGIGREIKSEGPLSLARAFLRAGARHVVASLYEVDDEATSELITRFYQELRRERRSPDAALRRAQLALARGDVHANPYFWAAFQVQSGSLEPLE